MISLPYREALFAILFCCVALVVPYCFADRTGALAVVPLISLWSHVVISLVMACALLGIFLFGWAAGRVPRRPTLWLDDGSRSFKMVLSAAYVTLAAQAILVALGAAGYIQGGILAARSLAAIDGIGVIVRLSFVSACLLCLFENRPEAIKRVLAVLLVLSLSRAIVFSERTAILEFAVTAIVAQRRGTLRLSFGTMVLVALFGVGLFAWIQDTRTAQFDATKAMDSSGALETAFRVYATYYGDVHNKFYLVANDVLHYPMVWLAEPFYRLVGEPFPVMNMLLGAWQSQTSHINSALNNPGGLAQDVSDLGLSLGLAWSLTKMFGCAFIIVRSRTSSIAMALAPIAYLQVIEYPRFNYVEQTYGFYLTLGALLLGWLVQRGAGRRNSVAALDVVQ